jgi:hypothetical protein
MNNQDESRSKAVWAVPAAVLIGAALVGYWYWTRPDAKELVPAVLAAEPAKPPTKIEEPAIRHPLTADSNSDATLPALADSDATLAAELSRLFSEATVTDWLVPDAIVRRFVATVDNLPRSKAAERVRPLRAVRGSFAVTRTAVNDSPGEETLVLAERNAARYSAAVMVIANLDMQQAAALYRRYYPLLQQTYEELGFPDRYFNDRLVEVIGHLLETPDLQGPIALVQPKVMFEYSDPALEARSAGQKLLMRMGPKHAAVIKAQLSKFREVITTKSPDSPVE